MTEQDWDKKVVLTHRSEGWEVTFRGEFISPRDLSLMERALRVKYRSYRMNRALTRRKGLDNA